MVFVCNVKTFMYIFGSVEKMEMETRKRRGMKHWQHGEGGECRRILGIYLYLYHRRRERRDWLPRRGMGEWHEGALVGWLNGLGGVP